VCSVLVEHNNSNCLWDWYREKYHFISFVPLWHSSPLQIPDIPEFKAPNYHTGDIWKLGEEFMTFQDFQDQMAESNTIGWLLPTSPSFSTLSILSYILSLSFHTFSLFFFIHAFSTLYILLIILYPLYPFIHSFSTLYLLSYILSLSFIHTFSTQYILSYILYPLYPFILHSLEANPLLSLYPY